MKPINEMSQAEKWKHIETTWTLKECLDGLDDMSVITDGYEPDYPTIEAITYRIHELTRWIPVSERLPTEADADQNGYVLVRERENESPHRTYHMVGRYNSLKVPDDFYTVTHWRRIDTP